MGATLNSMQDDVLAQLENIFPEYEVADWPDDPANYQLAHAKGAVLLVFSDRIFNKPQATDGTVVPNSPKFQIAFLTRSLRGKGDRGAAAYEMLDQTKKLHDDPDDPGLLGLPVSQGNLTIKREFFRTQKPGGVWIFGQNWQTFDVTD